MGLLYGKETKVGYQPSLLHELLKPTISGNSINGLGETTVRQATPVYHRRKHFHPWFWVQESFYARQYWDLIQGAIIIKSWWMDKMGHDAIAARQEHDTPANWTRLVKEKALEHPEADIIGIARITPDMIFDRDAQLGQVTEPWILIIGRQMDYQELATNLEKPDEKWRFWKNKFIPGVREVLGTYLRSQKAAWAVADWIRSKGYYARGHGGPKGGPINTLVAAMEAGLGQLGKHGSLIHDELGACMRFSLVLTDMPLVADTPRDIGVDEFCTSCRLCTVECPPQAISDQKQMVRGVEKWYVDFDKCVPYFNERYGCAICLTACPYSRPGIAPTLTRKMLEKKRNPRRVSTTALR